MEYADEKSYEEELDTEEIHSKDQDHHKKSDKARKNSGRKIIIRTLYNKFFLAIVFFLIWITFFDSNNLLYRYKLKRELHRMKNQKEYYEKEIAINGKIREQLTQDMDEIERYGREHYLMKRDGEDIFLIIDQ